MKAGPQIALALCALLAGCTAGTGARAPAATSTAAPETPSRGYLKVQRGTIVGVDERRMAQTSVYLDPGLRHVTAQFKVSGDDVAPGFRGRSYDSDLVCELGIWVEPGRNYLVSRVRFSGDRSGKAQRYYYGAEVYDDDGLVKKASCRWT